MANLEKAVLASVEEQRRSRRWGIFFKTLTFIYLLFIIVLMGKGCSTTKDGSTASSSSAHLQWLILLELLMLQAIRL
jgi:protease-4